MATFLFVLSVFITALASGFVLLADDWKHQRPALILAIAGLISAIIIAV